jgi:hypothetical protein
MHRFPIWTDVERLPYCIVRGLERSVDTGGLVPLCLATLVAYIYIVSRRS